MTKIKIGVAGIRRGASFLRAFCLGGRSEVTAICDLDQDRLAQASRDLDLADSHCFTDYTAFLNADLDAVVIGTPIPLHAEQTILALAAGKHVLCEVTAAHTLADCQRVYQAAKASPKKYMLAENYIYLDYIQQWKKYIAAGRIGRIHYAEAEYIHDIRDLLQDEKSKEELWRAGRPPLHYSTHCLGPLLFLLDDDVIVKATGMGNKSTIIPQEWPGAIDMQVGLFETRQGRILKILRSQVTPRKPHIITYNIYGSKGLLETGRTPGYETIGTRYFEGSDRAAVPMNCNGTELDAAPEIRFGGHGTSDYYLAQAFLDSIINDTKPPLDIDKAMAMTVPGLIAHAAAVQGQVWLDVPEFS